MDLNTPECSRDRDSRCNPERIEEFNRTEASAPQTPSLASPEAPLSFSLASTITSTAQSDQEKFEFMQSMPLILRPSYPTMCQTRSDLQSPMSVIMPSKPPSLFLQALSKLNHSSLSIGGLNQLKIAMPKAENQITGFLAGDITPPDSLTSAPPSYSFVLRQMAARRRPRLMGTFIPSPSFVQQAPPPTYATAFDIYVDNRITAPPQRVFNFGFTSMPAFCPNCGFTGMTIVMSKITLCTHMCAFVLCLFCCWICAPLPYIMRSCKDVYHYCRNCRTFLGMYCPTNPENNFN